MPGIIAMFLCCIGVVCAISIYGRLMTLIITRFVTPESCPFALTGKRFVTTKIEAEVDP